MIKPNKISKSSEDELSSKMVKPGKYRRNPSQYSGGELGGVGKIAWGWFGFEHPLWVSLVG